MRVNARIGERIQVTDMTGQVITTMTLAGFSGDGQVLLDLDIDRDAQVELSSPDEDEEEDEDFENEFDFGEPVGRRPHILARDRITFSEN